MRDNNKTILIIRLSALGDVGMTIPAIYSLALRYPEIHIKVLTRPFFSRLFINCPENISFILFQERHKGIRGTIRLIRELYKEDIYYVADFHNILRSWTIDLFFMFKGTNVAIVNKKRMERIFIRKKMVQSSSFVQRYAEVLSKLGFVVSPLIDRIPTTGKHLMPKCSFTKGTENWIGIAPMARYKNKTYPIDLMKIVINGLSHMKETRIFLFGSKEDKQILMSWENNNVKCIAGTMTIEKELALMSELDLMVSMVSANRHLASLVGTTVISIWGGTTPACGFLGWRQSHNNAIYADLKCQPCCIAGNDKCRFNDYRCLNIAPSTIISFITKSLPNDRKTCQTEQT